MSKIIFATVFLFQLQLSAAEFWFIPEPGALNVEMFTNPNQWDQTRAKMTRYSLVSLSLIPDIDGEIEKKLIQNNTFENFIRVDAFQKLNDWGIGLDVAVGSVKEEIHCDAKIYASEHSRIFDRIKRTGGQVKSFTMDWPRASGKLDCKQTPDQTATHVARYVDTVRNAYERAHPGETLEVGLWEGYPTFEPTELIQWLDAMIRHGYRPDYLTVDIDRDHHKRLKRNDAYMKRVLTTLKSACEARNIRFGVAFWSNDMKSPVTYRNDIMNWMKLVRSSVGTPDIMQMISWEYWVQKQNEGRVVPYNLPEQDTLSHTGLLLYGARYFGI